MNEQVRCVMRVQCIYFKCIRSREDLLREAVYGYKMQGYKVVSKQIEMVIFKGLSIRTKYLYTRMRRCNLYKLIPS